MTINIGLVTSDALVLGCDSIASTTQYYVDPFKIGWQTDASGKVIQDADGRLTLKVAFDDFEQLVSNAWGGVTKMFQITDSPSPMVAVTAGLAKLRDRSIASYGAEFLALQKGRPKKQKVVDCKEICDEFLKFVRKSYTSHYKSSTLPPQFREGPEFLVGGFGRDDEFPSLYRLSVQNNDVQEQFAPGNSGIAWNGQSDAVERFIRGYDSNLRSEVEQAISAELKKHSDQVKQYVADTVNNLLDTLGQKLPEGISIQLPELAGIPIDWQRYRVGLDYTNLPIQEAVNFVSFLVNLQAGKGRFARGVATVGGRTHIGVVTKEGFKPLNEPELAHRYTGFGDDL
jgi:hypothetical protein